MIIERITLDNIRSYQSHPPIELSTGVSLFEGDIGSGKSTILTAIEFALFGLGDTSGTYLLRHGAKTGSVLLEFSVNSKRYKVFRSLKRRRTSVTQQEGYLVEDNQRTDYSVTAMKIRILEFLSFNEQPKPRTSSLIYRYAIFTPQEEMKEVLFQPMERRLETLRRAFRVEDYSTIADNASIVQKWIDREAEILKRQTEDIDEKRTTLQEENYNIQKFTKEFKTLQDALEALKGDKKETAEEIEKLQEQKEAVIKIQAELPHLEDSLKQKVQLIAETTETIEKLKNELKEIDIAEEILALISPKYEELLAHKQKIELLDPSIEKIRNSNKEMEKLQVAIQKEERALQKQIQAFQNTSEKIQEWLIKNKPETLDMQH
jgi:exonuclease SbcC